MVQLLKKVVQNLDQVVQFTPDLSISEPCMRLKVVQKSGAIRAFHKRTSEIRCKV